MRRQLLPSVLFACHALLAQAPAPTPAPTPTPTPPVADPATPTSQIDLRAESMRQQIGDGKQVQSHVRVMVRLTNGNRITGVVKDGRLVERIDGLRFVEANADDKGAGVRIWYTAGARDFVFVPFRDFAEYKIIQKLSHAQLLQVESELQASLARKTAPVPAGEGKAGADGGETGATEGGDGLPPADQEPAGDAAGKAKAKEPAKDAAKDKPKDGDKAPAVGKDQQKAWFDLVQTYPPEDGWNEARRDELKRRFVVIGSKPSAVEQRFLDEYDEWKKACAYFGVEPTKDAGAGATDGAGAAKHKAKDDRKARRGKGSDPAAGGSDDKK
jgi:hypothetical protein